MRHLFGTFLTLLLGASSGAVADPPALPDVSSPEAVVARATAAHVDLLTALIENEKVPAEARGRIDDAIDASLRGGMEALEALRRARAERAEASALGAGTPPVEPTGLNRAIKAIEDATDVVTRKLDAVLERVPSDTAEVIMGVMARIDEKHAAVVEHLEGLMAAGISAGRSSARPEAPARPEAVRPARPEVPAQGLRPELALPVRPAIPERPARPEGRP